MEPEDKPKSTPAVSPDEVNSPSGTVAELAAKTEAAKRDATDKTAAEAAGMTLELYREMTAEKPKEKLPDNKYARKYAELMEELKTANEDVRGPLAFAAKLFLFLAKFQGIFGGFMTDSLGKSLDEGALKDEKLTEEQAQQVKKHADANNAPWTTADEEVVPDKYNNMTTSQASTRYVSSLLGLEELDDANLLAARLSHSTRNGANYYKKYNKSDIPTLAGKDVLPKGVVVFFKLGMSGELITGYSTGEGCQIAFFNAKAGKVEKFDLKTGRSTLGTVTCHLALFPRFNTDAQFFESKENQGLIDSALSGPLKQVSEAAAKSKADYNQQKFDIFNGNTNHAETIVNYIISEGLLGKAFIYRLQTVKEELEKIPSRDKKAATLEKFKSYVKEYKEFLDAESKSIQELIAKQKAKIIELEAPLKEEERTKVSATLQAAAEAALISIPDQDVRIEPSEDENLEGGTPQMSIDREFIVAEKKKAEKTIAAYEKLDKYIKKTGVEVEKYLN